MINRRTLTREEFNQLKAIMAKLEPGYAAVFHLHQWAPAGFHIIPGDGRVCCTPETWERLQTTAGIINEAKGPVRRAVMAHDA